MSEQTSTEEAGHETVSHDVSTEDKTVTRIVFIAVDHSPHSQYAFSWALENFVRPESDLVILANVRQNVMLPGPYGIGTIQFSQFVTNLEEHQRLESHRLLKTLAEKLREKNIMCKAIAMRGDPREEIVRKIKELKVDVLVMGCRQLGALKRTFLGSVSDFCAHHSHVPVLIVKEPQ
ncbi:uncharacterized protein VTP21DRAFT_2090 [Calcarisporiella thermophila]|uniref:uncharacterized protein n=1 Tax=Calcarisporiella thermophila TaxID=911321 RepID=UPI003742F686